MFLIHNSAQQAPILAGAIVGACRLSSGWFSDAQPRVLEALFEHLLGFRADFNALPAINPADVKEILLSSSQRRELIELMVTMEMMCCPIPQALQDSVDYWAKELEVDDSALVLVRELSRNAHIQATTDFYRLSWIGEGDAQDDPIFQRLLNDYGASVYALTVEPDPRETARWQVLKDCPMGSLGYELWLFYQKRGFKLPGVVGGANSALAHHDWVHVIAGYDTTAIGELEVTAFMASASRSPGSMLGFIGAVSIYETGLLQSLVTHSYSKTLSAPGGAERVVMAINAGKNCRFDPLIGVDYFSIADRSLEKIREEWGLSVKTRV